MKALLRPLLPATLKQRIRIGQRFFSDWQAGLLPRFAKVAAEPYALPYSIALSQAVHETPGAANKLHNIRLASANIAALAIEPGQYFSFWRAVGPPTAARGYRKGRNLVGQRLQMSYGGGLCQLAGLIYHTSLFAGLRVLERHHHSVDLYEEEERYTPLGADAAVAYGYLDLRLENNLGSPLAFRFSITEGRIACKLCAGQPMAEQQLRFLRRSRGPLIEVITERQTASGWAAIERSVYQQLD